MITHETVDAALGGEAEALQELIDAGQWRLEGANGRAMAGAIEAGVCMLGPRPVRDYWGNLVPAWWMVKAGTKGSPEYAGRDRPDEPSADEQRELCAAVGLELYEDAPSGEV